MNPKHVSAPLVIITAVSERNRQNVISATKSIGKQWREVGKAGQRDVVFTWMDGERWSSWLKSMYGVVDAGRAETPNVVIADHAVGIILPLSSVETLMCDDLESHLLRCWPRWGQDPADVSKYRIDSRECCKGKG